MISLPRPGRWLYYIVHVSKSHEQMVGRGSRSSIVQVACPSRMNNVIGDNGFTYLGSHVMCFISRCLGGGKTTCAACSWGTPALRSTAARYTTIACNWEATGGGTGSGATEGTGGGAGGCHWLEA